MTTTIDESPIWELDDNPDSPVLASAIHDGSTVRPQAAPFLLLSAEERRREEDPFTGGWTRAGGSRVVGLRSRFEVDLNRPREKAIYLRPEDAWGLEVFRAELPEEVITASLASYDSFYREMREVLDKLVKRHGRVVVLDLHSYNHRREGPDAPAADPAANPEVNVGTGTMQDRSIWAAVIERFMHDLSAFDFGGRNLDVRENVRFFGGNFAAWMHREFPGSACCLSVEFKKFFMDEWTGVPDQGQLKLIEEALAGTVPGIIEVLAAISNG